ncbi:hypothetical protein [Soonwooa sp.]|uniref:hypothetical protein n=1 Tax=Soonwooa sp. TaxID=1938592 RepID=UPI00289F7E12|nr:hypothetical protein [Soonwooa sp.]
MENQNTPQKDGFELLEKVIQSNEKNTSSIQEFAQKQTESITVMNGLLTELKQVETHIKQIADEIPKTVYLVYSPETQASVDGLKDQLNRRDFRKYYCSIMLVLALLIIVAAGSLSRKWFSESIRTETEIRQQMLEEIRDDGRSIYKVKDYEQLEYNTDMMNKWMKAYPKYGNEFMKFKKGFESR